MGTADMGMAGIAGVANTANTANTDKEKLLKQLTIMDFVATDLHLYLNTHPTDGEALKMYNEVLIHSKHLRKEYEKHFGPLVGYRSPDIAHGGQPPQWRWSECPWPWEADFNFKWDERWTPGTPGHPSGHHPGHLAGHHHPGHSAGHSTGHHHPGHSTGHHHPGPSAGHSAGFHPGPSTDHRTSRHHGEECF